MVKVLVKRTGIIYIACYRGRGNEPGPTPKGWQENRATRTYIDEVRQVFPRAAMLGGYIVAPCR